MPEASKRQQPDKARGAYAGFMDDRTGRIRPGMLADLVLLSEDIEAVAPHEIPGFAPVLTICDGRITHRV